MASACMHAVPLYSRQSWCVNARRYFIVQDGSLDVAAMRVAAAALLGEHDFRHFCKARPTRKPCVVAPSYFQRCLRAAFIMC